ncbi:TPA: pyruvate synthase subunit beta, partial [Candidatus Poribacteria bacterium]|nr:pyruvate synthase subunit beta [Candidatus Poribacteria bacterium]HEX29363.1 pyruvate synthase subunit beta [Candidatus Poribacteria bacterium]
IQRSSATPYGAWTTTTPDDNYKVRPKKNIIDIMVAHEVPYVATASVAYPEDFIRKMRKAKEKIGTKFIHIISPCPPGWRFPSNMTIKIARLAVQSRAFPLYEVEDGIYRITVNPQKVVPVEEYLRAQGRFRHLSDEEIKLIQKQVDERWWKLVKKVEESKG